jgi:uncharacterized protein YbjQ (UPF0145 family)
MKCTTCGEKSGFLMNLCATCIGAESAKRNEDIRNRQQNNAQQEMNEKSQKSALEKKSTNIIITTAPSLEGYRIVETLDIITSECVFGMNIFKDMFATFTDIFGGRSKSSQNILRDARKTCLLELKKEAATIGADAVIAVDLDYSEFSGGGKSMLFLVASGTAVKIDHI